MESESRIGVELSSFGSKTREELFFGDRTDVPETWDDWTYNKLLTPRTYATKWIEQVMPQFDLADEDVKALRAFLARRTDATVPVRYAYHAPGEERIIAGRRLVARYNCTGCHVIENTGGDIRRLYVATPTLAPPILLGEGEKVQAGWLFNFVKAPQPIRPWLSLRMPTFGLADEEANTVVGYFEALDRVQVPFVHIEKAGFSPESVSAGKLLTGKDYFDCFSCHQRGAQKPQGPPEDWAPDLALAHLRLNPEWILKWLHDPQKVMPGTKMPSFFPGGPPDVLGGDDEAQIRALRDYVVSLGLPDGPGGGIANVVVTVKATKGKKLEVPATNPVFDQKTCEFHPHVLVFPAGSTIDVINSDGILHNIHTTSTVNPSQNQAQPKFKPMIQIKIEKPETIAIKCDVHGWMSGYWVATETPYVAVTDASGTFKIADLPPGDYDVELWQEKLGKATQKASIKAKEETKVAWKMAAK